MRNQEFKGNLLLTLTALIWGCAFVAQSVSMDYIEPFTFQCIRSLIGSAVLVPVFLLLDRKNKRNGNHVFPTREHRKKLWSAGLVCGIIMTIAANLQQIGIQYTTAGKAGFITAMYILIVPVLGLFLGKKVSPRLWVCILIATMALYFLSVTEGFSSIGKGDIYVLMCAVAFSFHIMAVDYYAPLVDGVRLSCIQFLVCGILSGFVMLWKETPNIHSIINAGIPILYSGVMSCGIAYTLQIIGQKYTRPTVASLLMSLESVFAVLAGIIVLHEIPTLREAFGCILMFAAIILAQLPDKHRAEIKQSKI